MRLLPLAGTIIEMIGGELPLGEIDDGGIGLGPLGTGVKLAAPPVVGQFPMPIDTPRNWYSVSKRPPKEILA